MKKFYVSNGSGGYAEKFEWLEAEEIARTESKESGEIRLIEDDDTVVALFHDGERYIKASGQACEQCGKVLDADSAHYAYELTKRFFCSSKCGLELGVLMKGSE